MSQQTTLVTGFPSNELATRVVSRLLEQEASTHLTLLVPERFVDHASEWLSALPMAQRERTQLLNGDVAALDMGLSGREYLELAERVERIHHCAAVTYSGAPFSMAERVNVGGTFEMLELARTAKHAPRIVHWSSISATAGKYGVVREDELVAPRSGSLAHTRYRAEKLIDKARGALPITVVRTAMLVGDSRTGRMARLDGAYLLISVLLNAPRDVPLLLPAQGSAQLQVVPIDYAVDAGLAIAGAAESVGGTFHVIDRGALTLDGALGHIAELLGKPPPRGGLAPSLAQVVLRIPGLDKLVHAQRALLDELARDVRYDDKHAQQILAHSGLSCPSFASYVGQLVSHVERERKSDRPSPSYAIGR